MSSALRPSETDPVGAGGRLRAAPSGGRPSRFSAFGSTRRAVAQFALSGLLAVTLLGVAGVELLKRTGTAEAIRDARQETALAGRGVVGPDLLEGLVAGRPGARGEIDRIVRERVLGGAVVRVKVWAPDGRILYSDDRRLVGARYPLDVGELGALRRGGTDAELSDLGRPENRDERRYGKLLEVYLGVRTRSGRPLLFETYRRFASISASGRRLWLQFAPALIAVLVLLEVAQIPLAWSLTRRLRRSQREREDLLRRAIEASDVERTRIARDLHDGVVQNLAGVSYGLAAAAERLSPGRDPAARLVEDAASETRRTIRELRTLLVDLYPASLHHQGLRAALDDAVAPLAAHGLLVRVEVDDGLHLAPAPEAVLFRAVQEALRNVLKHAEAGEVEVRISRRDGLAQALVLDDGRGFHPASQPDPGRSFGLRMLDDLVREAGGRLDVASRPGEGTRVVVEVPT